MLASEAQTNPQPSPRTEGPTRVTSNVRTTEITAHFLKAALDLDFGQLVKDEGFSLFEAVGALEIGDSKMDSGYLQDGETLEDDYDVAATLTPEEVVWLMDELICHEVAWLTGYPLSQTLFTSLYLDRLLWPEPKTVDDATFSASPTARQHDPLLHVVFRSYCLALIKSCDLVHTTVTAQHYYEEEDFASQLYHRELLHRFACESIYPFIEDARSWLETAEVESSLKQALIERLDLRKMLLRTLQKNALHQKPAESDVLTCLELLGPRKGMVRIGTPVYAAFSLKIQRGLASNVPPRPMVTVDYEQALAYFSRFFIDSTKIFELFSAESSGELWTAYWTIFSQRPQPSVYIRALAQSFLTKNEEVIGRFSIKPFILDNVKSLVLPASPLLDPLDENLADQDDRRFQVAKRLEEFVGFCGQSYLNLFRTTCLNRCRIRRTLCHAVTEWDHLQAEVEEIDSTLQVLTSERPRPYPPGMPLTFSYPLSSWVYHHKLSQMEVLIQMGFELVIYTPGELHQMYWYLSHISAVHLSHLDRVSFFVENSTQRTSFAGASFLTDQSSDRKDVDECLLTLFRHFTYLKAVEAFSRALHRLYAVLMRHGALSKPHRPFASDKLRYELRMRPFLRLSIPEPIEFEEFQEVTSLHDITDSQALEEASYSVGAARKSFEEIIKAKWKGQTMSNSTTSAYKAFSNGKHAMKSVEDEWTKNLRGVLKSCIATSITIGAVKKQLTVSENSHKTGSHKLRANLPIPGDRDYFHEWWLVPRIVQ